MELSIKTYILLFSILFTGLTAGLCFTWSNAVTSGIGRLDDFNFLQSFQSMNRAIINRGFLIIFFSPSILLLVNVFLFKNASQGAFVSFLIAAILFLVGVGWVTIFRNIPLNELLDTIILETATKVELADLRKTFEQPWNRWHMVRTVCSFTSFALLLMGLVYDK
ncbi:anthrone oxygenase family protein [Aquimarina sp. M1]